MEILLVVEIEMIYLEHFAQWLAYSNYPKARVLTRGGPRTECLWMNYAPDAAHWATHAGVDFTDRQRIKRKAARWKRMFSELPAGERIAILAALLEVDS